MHKYSYLKELISWFIDFMNIAKKCMHLKGCPPDIEFQKKENQQDKH